MKLILSNPSDGIQRELEVQGNPLITYDEFRAGSGIPGQPEGDGNTILILLEGGEWQLLEDRSLWSDVEVIEA